MAGREACATRRTSDPAEEGVPIAAARKQTRRPTQPTQPTQPTAELLEFPAPYGTPKKKLAWSTVRRSLEEAKQYWLTTVRVDGRPHVVPLDGMWIDDVWYYGGSPATVHRRLVEKQPQVAMHLPDPWKVVVVEGVVRLTDTTPEFAQRLVDTTNEKYAEYGYQVDPARYVQVLGLYPTRVLAWTNFPKDATRFTFG
jgi:nitroimidazol reductase NimA-like FMN-containing flavoprotein (pyridoxamine 5'-phosphate oxidase superfamily)